MMHDVPDSVKHIWTPLRNLYAFAMRLDSF
jgi:hypothetical protein